ncbi:hypothetical protein SAMN05428975_2941 [Mucilaginibacter sp. OK268]|uniref:hypothetical protein n=1 Tax=Mucilaginibacter sp. OK268 TaxID=1881048 RepID=UPI000886F392|nr:hypothetical protein [Mucilaginibacter sp. OK268]SDP81642.1 hypothetical protein SAMN05428975_2941 [Mucilaginibacter sp. OK268]
MEQTKEEIIALLKNPDVLTNDQIMDVFFKIGRLGDIFILKNDGARENYVYTVVISSSKGSFDSIRFDGDDLNVIVRKALNEYVET